MRLVLRPSTPPVGWGIAAAALLVTVEVIIVQLLQRISPENAFGAVLLFGVLVVSAMWGFGLAIAMSLVSTGAYAYIHVLESRESLIPAVLVFLVLALLANALVGQSRIRAVESYERRCEADLLAELARTMLRTTDSTDVLSAAGVRLSEVLRLAPPGALLGPHDATAGSGRQRIMLYDDEIPRWSLVVSTDLTSAEERRVRRVVPSLEALLAAARDRRRLHDRTVALARQQAALRRIATLVATRVEPGDVFPAVATELAAGLGLEHVSLVRYDEDAHYTVLASRDDVDGYDVLRPGERLSLGGHNVTTTVHSTGRPTTMDFTRATGHIAERLEGRGLLTGVGVPIDVAGRIWGAVVVGSADAVPDPDIAGRLTDFADLVATAVYDSETRAELTRSRARVVAAADQARRTIERDLHDGAQQRIVSLGMDLRAAQGSIPAEMNDLRLRLDRSVDTLTQVHSDLQELSRGLHPAILSRGGIGPALKTLARRAPFPVALMIDIPGRLPDPVEVAAYYLVAEALTNTAKYADAVEIDVTAVVQGGVLTITVSDDGVGGADTAHGSGLIGLHDRIAAAGGTLVISSPPGDGTTLIATITVAERDRPPLPASR